MTANDRKCGCGKTDCGEKAERNAASAEKAENNAAPKKKLSAANVIFNAILLAIVACIILAFIPASSHPVVDKSVSEGANDKIYYVINDKNSDRFVYLFKKMGKLDTVRFSCKEMDYLFNNSYLTNEAINMDTGFDVKEAKFSSSGDELEITLFTKAAGVIPMTFTVRGKVGKDAKSASKIAFDLTSAKVGCLPVWLKYSKFVTDRFTPVVECLTEVSTLFMVSSDVRMVDGELVCKFKK